MSTGRLDEPGVHGDPLLATAHQLSEAVYDWWGASPPPLVYRTRSTPSAHSIAFTRTVVWDDTGSGWLRDAIGLLVQLVTRFTIPDHWLR